MTASTTATLRIDSKVPEVVDSFRINFNSKGNSSKKKIWHTLWSSNQGLGKDIQMQ